MMNMNDGEVRVGRSYWSRRGNSTNLKNIKWERYHLMRTRSSGLPTSASLSDQQVAEQAVNCSATCPLHPVSETSRSAQLLIGQADGATFGLHISSPFSSRFTNDLLSTQMFFCSLSRCWQLSRSTLPGALSLMRPLTQPRERLQVTRWTLSCLPIRWACPHFGNRLLLLLSTTRNRWEHYYMTYAKC